MNSLTKERERLTKNMEVLRARESCNATIMTSNLYFIFRIKLKAKASREIEIVK